MIGGVVSTTATVWLTGPETLPHASRARHVIVLLYVLPQAGVVTSETSSTEAEPHPSNAVGAVKLGAAGHSTVPFGPWPEIDGGVVSTTAIVWLTGSETLPHASRARQVIVRLYVLPQAGVVTSETSSTEAEPHPSNAVGAVKLGAPGHSTVQFGPWPEIDGGVVSTTAIVW